MAQLMMWNIVLFGHMKKQLKWAFLYPTLSRTHHPQSKYCRDATSPQLLIQHNLRIFIQLLLAIPPIYLVNRLFLKLLSLSHILHLMNTRCLLPLNRNVTEQQFSTSEYITIARDFIICQACSPILLTLVTL